LFGFVAHVCLTTTYNPWVQVFHTMPVPFFFIMTVKQKSYLVQQTVQALRINNLII